MSARDAPTSMSRGGVRRLVAVLIGSPRTRQPENSVSFRVAVLGAVMTSAAAVAMAGVIEGAVPLVVFLVLTTAFWFSWERRAKKNGLLSILFTAIAAVALFDLLSEIGSISNPEQARYPLAKLFLLVQLIRSYDLISRRDLYFSLGSSLVLMAVAGSISQDLGFGITLFVYAAFACTALVLGNRSELADGTVATFSSRRRPTMARIPRQVLRAAFAAAAGGLLLFGVLPQPNGVRPFALPFSTGPGSGTPALGGISNPGFSAIAGTRSSGSSYYGLSERMDLRVRGSLSDDIVMRVRASAPAMWRGTLFDTYDGSAWSSSAGESAPLAGSRPYLNPGAFGERGPRTLISQTFYIESEQPSTYFAATTPSQIWTDSQPSIDELGALRATTTLAPGTVYSVVSVKGTAPPSALERAPVSGAAPTMNRYLQLPAALPDRVGALARRITASADNDYERVRAIEAYLREHYRYSLDSPIPPAGRDAVDHFLFDARVGFCEQFASATAVMLRTLGVPARVAVGYTPGQRNPLTGYYEVKGSNAHAWVEVYFPGYGWYEFDPTFDVPLAKEGVGDNIAAVKLWRFASAHLDELVPQVPLAAGALAVPVGALLVLRRRVRKRSRASGGEDRPGIAPGPVARAWERLEADLERRGIPRRAHETAAETMARLVGSGSDQAAHSVGVFERERYGRGDVPPGDARAASHALEDVRRRLGTRPPAQ